MGLFNDVSEYTCVECGATMEKADEEVLICPKCQHSVDIEDYGYEDEYDDYFSSIQVDIEKPEYCGICDGPWPDCETSCKLFDD